MPMCLDKNLKIEQKMLSTRLGLAWAPGNSALTSIPLAVGMSLSQMATILEHPLCGDCEEQCRCLQEAIV